MVRRNVPLVEQVVLEVLSEIDGGRFARQDGLLPSEAELSQKFGVSRATVREALGKLELAGVVIRRQGVGTFVNQFLSNQPAIVQEWFDEAHGFVDAIRSSGQSATCRFLVAAVEPAGELGQQLQIAADAPVLVTEKIIISGSVPLIHSYNAMPLRLLPEDLWDQAMGLATSTDSIYKFLELYCNARVHHQQSEVRASLVGEVLAPLLECQPTDPCLKGEEVAYNVDLTPLFYGRSHFRADIVSFRQVRRPSISIGAMTPVEN